MTAVTIRKLSTRKMLNIQSLSIDIDWHEKRAVTVGKEGGVQRREVKAISKDGQ